MGGAGRAAELGRSRRPYSAREAAALLGISHDTHTHRYWSVHGFRLGVRVIFLRWDIDRMVADPEAGRAGAAEQPGEASVVERVLALLAFLSAVDLRTVTRAVLAREAGVTSLHAPVVSGRSAAVRRRSER